MVVLKGKYAKIVEEIEESLEHSEIERPTMSDSEAYDLYKLSTMYEIDMPFRYLVRAFVLVYRDCVMAGKPLIIADALKAVCAQLEQKRTVN
jgi:hypothetical protein